MEYKIRKLKAVGIRQNAPQPSAMSLRLPALHKAAVGLAGPSLLALALALSALPRPALVLASFAIALAIRAVNAGQDPRASAETRSGIG